MIANRPHRPLADLDSTAPPNIGEWQAWRAAKTLRSRSRCCEVEENIGRRNGTITGSIKDHSEVREAERSRTKTFNEPT